MSIRLTIAFFSAGLLTGCDAQWGRTGGPVMNEAQTSADAFDTAPAGSNTPPPMTDEPAPVASQPQSEPSAQAEPAGAVATAPPPADSHDPSAETIFNARELANDPNWELVGGPSQVQGASVPGTAYLRGSAIAGTANLTRWIQNEQALNGRYPTYQELSDYIRQYPPQMPVIRNNQRYAYDEMTGEIVVFEYRQ